MYRVKLNLRGCIDAMSTDVNFTDINYFAVLPDEILLLIFEYIPDHWPVLRKLDRVWRALLECEHRPDCDYVKLLMPTYGYKYNRGILTINDIYCDVIAGSYSALLYMDYRILQIYTTPIHNKN